jgi:NADPH:quinone reductase-like Zn-dependent oxidoreductase
MEEYLDRYRLLVRHSIAKNFPPPQRLPEAGTAASFAETGRTFRLFNHGDTGKHGEILGKHTLTTEGTERHGERKESVKVLVTGASSGIGEVTAKMFAAEGAAVVLV